MKIASGCGSPQARRVRSPRRSSGRAHRARPRCGGSVRRVQGRLDATARMDGSPASTRWRRTGARADVPQHFAVAGREGRQRDRPHIVLGDLAVMLEQIVGMPGVSGRMRAWCDSISQRQTLSGLMSCEIKAAAVAAPNALIGPPSASSMVSPEAPNPLSASSAATRPGRAIRCQRQHAAPGATAGESAMACRAATPSHVLQRPAEPGAASEKAEGAGNRQYLLAAICLARVTPTPCRRDRRRPARRPFCPRSAMPARISRPTGRPCPAPRP